MPSPFPGMDPYLERRHVWPDVHSALIVAKQDALLDYRQPPEPLLSPPDAAWADALLRRKGLRS